MAQLRELRHWGRSVGHTFLSLANDTTGARTIAVQYRTFLTFEAAQGRWAGSAQTAQG